MPIAPDAFQQKIKERVRAHYAINRTPLLLAHLGAEIERNDEWPTDKGQRFKLAPESPDPIESSDLRAKALALFRLLQVGPRGCH